MNTVCDDVRMTDRNAFAVVNQFGDKYGIAGFLEIMIVMKEYHRQGTLTENESQAFNIVANMGQHMFAPKSEKQS